jgi:hypothetical protein
LHSQSKRYFRYPNQSHLGGFPFIYENVTFKLKTYKCYFFISNYLSSFIRKNYCVFCKNVYVKAHTKRNYFTSARNVINYSRYHEDRNFKLTGIIWYQLTWRRNCPSQRSPPTCPDGSNCYPRAFPSKSQALPDIRGIQARPLFSPSTIQFAPNEMQHGTGQRKEKWGARASERKFKDRFLSKNLTGPYFQPLQSNPHPLTVFI